MHVVVSASRTGRVRAETDHRHQSLRSARGGIEGGPPRVLLLCTGLMTNDNESMIDQSRYTLCLACVLALQLL